MHLAYYNEIDPYAAEWLGNLILAGHIAPGIVDTRSIEDVTPNDLRGFTQCHFFAGIGVWSLALRRAGWADSRPVWSASCPCQPFSTAGQGAGFDDERHLWPHLHWLAQQCRPPVIVGEQVASKDADPWIDLVSADMEALGYAFGAIAFPSAGVGAPHIRDRTYWVGHADHPGLEGLRGGHRAEGRHREGTIRPVAEAGQSGGLGHSDSQHPGGYAGTGDQAKADGGLWSGGDSAGASGGVRGVADADGGHASTEWEQRSGEQRQQPQDGVARGLAHDHSAGRSGLGAPRLHERRAGEGGSEPAQGGADRALGHDVDGRGAHGGLADAEQHRGGREASAPDLGQSQADRPADQHGRHRGAPVADGHPRPTHGFWRDADWLLCRDGKWRPVEPGTFPLAHGAPSRVGRLRAYGNAVNAAAAQAWVECVM